MRAGRVLFIVALLFIFSFTVACSESSFNRAQEYEMNGKDASALQAYRHALSQTPPQNGQRRAEILTRIGECLYRMDRIQESFTTFQRATEADPRVVAARLRMGQMLLLAGAPERAREQAMHILQRMPNNSDALMLLGASFSESGDLDEAKHAYTRVLATDPRHVKVALALADIYNRQGQQSEARQILENAAAANPTSADPWLALARLDEQQGNSDSAEHAYRKAVSVQDDPETNLRLAQFLQRSARIPEAEQVLRKVDALQPTYPVALADFELLSGRPDDALGQYRKALDATRASLSKPPSHPDLWSISGFRKRVSAKQQTHAHETTIAARIIEAEIESASRLPANKRKHALSAVRSALVQNWARFDEATTDILETEVALAEDNFPLAKLFAGAAINVAPASAPALYVAGLVAAASGDRQKAESRWQDALDQDPRFSPARVALAEDALARGDGHDADRQARAVVRQDPGDLHAVLLFARALLLEHRPLPAAIMAERAAALDPRSAIPSLIMGEVALSVKNQAQALLHFERALALQPDSEEAINGLLRVYRQGHISKAAIRKIEIVAQEPPVSPTMLEIAGRLYAERGSYADAIRALKLSIQADPKRITAARVLAHLQAATGDYAGATNSAMKAGVDAKALLTAYHQQDTGDWHAAAETYERALREGDQTGVAANNVAWIYAQHNTKLNRALALAETAAQESPNNPAVLDTLGFVHLQRREYSEAVRSLETAARLAAVQKNDSQLTDQIRAHLSEAYMRTGQTEAALRVAQNRNPFVIR